MSVVASSLGGMPEDDRPLRPLVLSEAEVDRDAAARERPDLTGELLADPATGVLDVRGDRVPVDPPREAGHNGVTLVLRAPEPDDARRLAGDVIALYLGRVGSVRRPVLALLQPPLDAGDEAAADADDGDANANADAVEPRWATLREVGLELDVDGLAMATEAVAMGHWHGAHPRCPRCGVLTDTQQAGWVRVCPNDGSHHFPRTDPAVIMAVVHAGVDDGVERILLARGSRWGGIHRSVLAGFVEPGESFEAAVARETFEEAGVTVGDVTYLGNQPWPFPASLMVGFVAEATSTQLVPQEGEIEEIAWYSRADIAEGIAAGTLRLPGALSIAHALIERWYGDTLPTPPAREDGRR